MNETRTKEHSQDIELRDPREILNALRNNPNTRQKIHDSFDQMGGLVSERTALNDQLAVIREKLHGLGIPKKAIKLAFSLYQMTDGDITDTMIGLATCAASTGKNMQFELLLPEVSQHGPKAA